MKIKPIITVLSFVFGVFIISCQENDSLDTIEKQTNLGGESNMRQPQELTPRFFNVAWDEWGRASNDCDGWGLCNFSACFGCCFDEWDRQVDCETGQVLRMGGEIAIDTTTNLGYMTIKLDTSYDVQKDAIDNQWNFYIDEDIIEDDITLIKGVYPYDSGIGPNGGYEINASNK